MKNIDSSLIRKRLSVKHATKQSISGFGSLIIPPEKKIKGNTGFYGSSVITSPIEFISNNDTSLTLATMYPRPFEVRWMEYHNKHTQTFVPIGSKPFVMVLGKPTCRLPDGTWDSKASENPVIEEVEAFYFDGSAGFVLNIGTWHEFPFAIFADTNVLVILTNETTNDLKKVEAGEAKGGDLCKRDLQKRFNIIFELNVEKFKN